MFINVQITLGKDQTLAYTPDAAAAQVIAALGGNPTIDYCQVRVQTSLEPGEAGTPPPPAA